METQPEEATCLQMEEPPLLPQQGQGLVPREEEDHWSSGWHKQWGHQLLWKLLCCTHRNRLTGENMRLSLSKAFPADTWALVHKSDFLANLIRIRFHRQEEEQGGKLL